MTRKPPNKLGKLGEEIAASYLEEMGYIILEQNYFFEHAEVDIVAFDGKKIIFVEVKARSDTSFGNPEDHISDKKIDLIFKAAEAWLYERKMEGAHVQFDVISIIQDTDQPPEISHFKDTFRRYGSL